MNDRFGKIGLGFVAIVLGLVAASWTTIGAQRDGRGAAPAAGAEFPVDGSGSNAAHPA